jgi:PAS domain S-box-containing protein
MSNTVNYFDALFHNAKQNAIMTMDKNGIIQQVNEAFTTAYGYTTEDLQSKHFRLLYIDKDKVLLKPEIELNKTLREGASGDENYLVHKDTTPIWVSGESVLVKTENETNIIKVIHNIHAQKQLERYLLASNELMNDLFNSVHSALLLLDNSLRTIKSNKAFLRLFELNTPIIEGNKIQQIPHPFWSDPEVKNDIRNVLVKGEKINKEYITGNGKSNYRKIHITSKRMTGDDNSEKRLLLVVKEA